MNRTSDIANEPRGAARKWAAERPSVGFTLVEMLVVISIIGILAGLIVPATMMAVRHAKVAAVSVELKQLEAACQAYKERFGEYPPDFSGLDNTNTDPATGVTYQVEAQNRILQHLSTAFSRYQPGVSQNWVSPYTGWRGFLADVGNGWGVGPDYFTTGQNSHVFSPSSAVLFWLGGQPDWQRDSSGNTIPPSNNAFDPKNPVRGFLGFSANPLNPFDNGASRISPFMDFHVGGCAWLGFAAGTPPGGLAYWAKGTEGGRTSEPIMYFRAENGNYTYDGALALADFSNVKRLMTDRCTTTACTPIYIWPIADSGLSNLTGSPPVYSWMNPSSFQIFSAGLGMKYGMYGPNFGPLMYPSGTNYVPDTLDDITNFSGGTLESKMP